MLIFSACLLGAQQAENPKRQEPSLAETEEWITQTFTDMNTGKTLCGEFNSYVPSSEYGPDLSCNFEFYTLEFDQCEVKFYTRYAHTLINAAQNIRELAVRDQQMDYLLSFTLSDIDPTSISVTDLKQGSLGPLDKKTFHPNIPYVAVNFRTTNDKNSMVESKPDGTGKMAVHDCCTFGSGIGMEPNYAPRFVRALRHAVELCGGKPSAF
jgi:hypothetical protein